MKKPYRSVEFNNERKWKNIAPTTPFDDVLQVGIHKAIGYVFIDNRVTCADRKKDVASLIESLYKSDKLVFRRDCFLYAGDTAMMMPIINKQKKVLIRASWPTDAKQLFEKICNTDVDHNDDGDLYHLIADLFNSWCLWCETPIRKGNNFLSSHPYDPDIKK